MQISEREACDGFTRLKLSYASDEGDRVPAYLLLPQGPPGRRRAVLALHQTTSIGKRKPAGGTRQRVDGAANMHYAASLPPRLRGPRA